MYKEWIIPDIQNLHSMDMCMGQEDKEDPRRDDWHGEGQLQTTWHRHSSSNIVLHGGAWWSCLCAHLRRHGNKSSKSITQHRLNTRLYSQRTSDAYFYGIIVKLVNDKLTGCAVLLVDGEKTRRAALLQFSTRLHNFMRQDDFHIRQYFTLAVDNHDANNKWLILFKHNLSFYFSYRIPGYNLD